MSLPSLSVMGPILGGLSAGSNRYFPLALPESFRCFLHRVRVFFLSSATAAPYVGERVGGRVDSVGNDGCPNPYKVFGSFGRRGP